MLNWTSFVGQLFYPVGREMMGKRRFLILASNKFHFLEYMIIMDIDIRGYYDRGKIVVNLGF